jgi:GGDEF domain-containing protein
VADAPVDALLARADELGKGWLLALIEDARLSEVPGLPIERIALAGPGLCAGVVRALAADDALEDVRAAAARIADAWGGAGAALAGVSALHAVVWSALLDELGEPDGMQVAALAGRLQFVADALREAVPAEGRDVAPSPTRDDGPAGARDVEEPSSAAAGIGTAPAVDAEADPGADALLALAREVRRAHGTGRPLSLLVAELEDAERMLAVERAPVVARALSRFGDAVRSALRRDDLLLAEGDGRAWVVARSGRAGAQALAERIAGEVRHARSWQAGPLSAAVGVAVLGEDAGDAEGLLDAAEQAALIAVASGLSVARVPESPDGA